MSEVNARIVEVPREFKIRRIVPDVGSDNSELSGANGYIAINLCPAAAHTVPAKTLVIDRTASAAYAGAIILEAD